MGVNDGDSCAAVQMCSVQMNGALRNGYNGELLLFNNCNKIITVIITYNNCKKTVPRPQRIALSSRLVNPSSGRSISTSGTWLMSLVMISEVIRFSLMVSPGP